METLSVEVVGKAHPTASMKSLAKLAIGDSAQIVSIIGSDTIAIRLLEMGLTPGEAISLLGYAPLGDPIEFSVRGYRITLRAVEAERILVEESGGRGGGEAGRRGEVRDRARNA